MKPINILLNISEKAMEPAVIRLCSIAFMFSSKGVPLYTSSSTLLMVLM